MNGKRDISDLDLRVTIKQWNVIQDAGGGSFYTEALSWDTWANKMNVSGSQINNESQQQWYYNTVFKVRYNPAIKSNMTVDQGGARWLINSIEVDNEGYQGFMKLSCSKTDINIDVS